MVKTPDELFKLWLDGELLPGETRRDLCKRQGIEISDMYWAFCAGASYSSLNRFANED